MPQTLHSSSSAQSSPVLSKGLSTNFRANNTAPSTTPTRKAPRCSKCGRPRAGHPRSGCPFVDLPQPKESNLVAEIRLNDAIGSMVPDPSGLGQRDELEDSRAFIRNRRRESAQLVILQNESPMTLPADSKEIAERLSQLGVFDDKQEEGKGEASEETTHTKKKMTVHARSPTPCIPIPSKTESSFVSSNKEEMESASAKSIHPLSYEDEGELRIDEDQDQEGRIARSHGSFASTAMGRPHPLERTMSADECDIFISKLSGQASATIYLLPKADANAILTQARNLRFIVEPVMYENADDPNALIILGRENSAVQALVKKVEPKNKEAETTEWRSPALRTIAAAVVLGAVGVWAGLAFS